MPETELTAADLDQVRARGLTLEEASRQLDLLHHPPSPIRLHAPCVAGDGIDRIEEAELPDLLRSHEEAASAGRCLKFVPASGAATRMFKSLLEVASGRESGRDDLARFLEGLPRFAFHRELREEIARAGADLDALVERGEHEEILRALLDDERMGCASLPKGLLKFHLGPEGALTAFEEHLDEATAVFKDSRGECRLHFTISPEHESRFRSLLASRGPAIEKRRGARFRVEFSTQSPATDTLALDAGGLPFRQDDGRLLFRPSGHGALLPNLQATGADLVFVKNIDNVAPEHRREIGLTWIRALTGLLVRVQRETHRALEALAGGGPSGGIASARALAEKTLHLHLGGRFGALPAPEQRRILADRLDRPLRVCGMVRNEGEPGGGPFWVAGEDGARSLQIVEASQVDASSEDQMRILSGATHFNPVFMACALRDAGGRPHELERFVDPNAVILARKSTEGRELLALERPGLWNGAMAGWLTLFVEVPPEVFTPVKTVLDLLRPAHQPG